MSLYRAIRAVLFLLDAEFVHRTTMRLLRICARLMPWMRRPRPRTFPRLKQHILGTTFTHPVGLAGGFVKSPHDFPAAELFDFSFIEVGTITGNRQEGNPKPRLFRLPADRAIVNRFGFNNPGALTAANVLSLSRRHRTLFANVGKSKTVDAPHAISDIVNTFETLLPAADWVVLNLASPNTPGLRQLLTVDTLRDLEGRFADVCLKNASNPPILIKLHADMTDEAFDELLGYIASSTYAGVVCINTTVSREGLHTPAETIRQIGDGGLSGAPLKQRARKAVRRARAVLGPDKVVIGVGGVETAMDVHELIRCGADLVEVYTGFIYGGPMFVHRLVDDLDRILMLERTTVPELRRLGTRQPLA